MNNESEIKQEFEEFIESLVQDIMKSIFYEDLKNLESNFELTNKELKANSKNIDKLSNKLKDNISGLNNSSNNIIESSKFLKNNIEELKNKIRNDIEKKIDKSVEYNKKNMIDLSKSISIMKDQIIKENKDNIIKLTDETTKIDSSIGRGIKNIQNETIKIEILVKKDISDLKEFIKKFSIGIIILLVLNMSLIIYLIYSKF